MAHQAQTTTSRSHNEITEASGYVMTTGKLLVRGLTVGGYPPAGLGEI